MISKTAIISEDVCLGKDIKIWHNVQIRENVQIGNNVSIGKDCYIDKNVIIGSNVKIQNSVNIYNGVIVEDDVFIGPNVTFSNDIYPRANNKEWTCIKTVLRKGCSVGANSVIIPGIDIGKYSLIGAGSVVVQSVDPYSLVVGNPAQNIGYVCSCGIKLNSSFVCHKCGKMYKVENGEVCINEL